MNSKTNMTRHDNEIIIGICNTPFARFCMKNLFGGKSSVLKNHRKFVSSRTPHIRYSHEVNRFNLVNLTATKLISSNSPTSPFIQCFFVYLPQGFTVNHRAVAHLYNNSSKSFLFINCSKTKIKYRLR